MSTQGEPMDLTSDTPPPSPRVIKIDPKKSSELTQEERVKKLWNEFDRAVSSSQSS